MKLIDAAILEMALSGIVPKAIIESVIEKYTVKAISVEWLEDWWKKHSEEYSSGINGWYEVEGFYPNIFNKLLSDWEKENETGNSDRTY